MTKKEELAILKEAIAKLGMDSYLGPWLANVCEEVKANMLSDYEPSICLAHYVAIGEREKARLIAEGEKEACDITRKAQAIHAQAEAKRASVYRMLLSASEELKNY